MKILVTLCGRAGSKGFKNKNVQLFLGSPLSYYTLSVVDLFSKDNPEYHIDVVCNTDSPELAKQVSDYPMDVDFIPRAKELAGDLVGKKDVIADSYNKIREFKKTEYDVIIDLDITSPLRTVEDISNVVNEFKSSKADIVFSVTESRRNPFFNMVCKEKDSSWYGRVINSNYTTRQEAPAIYDMNASIYAYKPEVLKIKNGLFENKCQIVTMKDTGVLDIDSNEDFKLMEVIAKYLYENEDSFKRIFENLNRGI